MSRNNTSELIVHACLRRLLVAKRKDPLRDRHEIITISGDCASRVIERDHFYELREIQEDIYLYYPVVLVTSSLGLL